MSVELTIASSVGKAIFPAVAKELIAKFNSALNPTDLEKALKAGINAAEEWDTTQPSEKNLFYHCEPKLAREHLERFFKDTGVQEELQKPFKEKTILDIELLIQIFQKLASENKDLKFPDKSIENWLGKFGDAYFEKTNTYLKFQEYLTAQEIRDRQEDDFDEVLKHIREHLHNSHWREVLLLLIAQQKRSNPKKVIEEILIK